MKSLKRRIASWITGWLVPEQRIEAKTIRRNADGSVSATHTFHSLKDAQRFQRFVALQRNPLGRRAIQWLIRAGAGP
jgi:hypothetical protein